MPDMRSAAIKLEFPEGTLEANVGLPDGNERLVAMAFKLLAISGEVADMAAGAARSLGQEITCAKGCGDCCRQLVPLSPPEAAIIAELVATMPAPRKEAVLRRFADGLRKLEESGFLDRLAKLDDPHLGDSEATAIMRDYCFQGIACPFLVDESCSIYEVRPSMCREYLVTSPVEHCQRFEDDKIVRLPVSVRLSEALARVWADALGEPVRLVPLILALRWTEANPDIRALGGDSRSLLQTLLDHIGAVVDQRADKALSTKST